MIDHFLSLGVTAVELLPVHQFVDRPASRRARAHELLGLQHDRLLRARRALRDARARQAGVRVQDDGEDAALGRHRGDPRRRVQPHRRGQPPRARRCRCAASTTRRTTGSTPTTRATTSTSPARATASTCMHPRTIQLIMDSLRYWVERDARRRLPLRPRAGARARAATRWTGSRRSSTSSSRTRCSRGEAHRRAVGRRAGRLPGRQLPVRWAEWNGKYRDAIRRFWRGDDGVVPELASRLAGSATSIRAATARRTPASTSSPRTTASRCTTS